MRTLNAAVHQVEIPNFIQLTSVPPIVMLDAIWVPLLQDTSTLRPDLLKRQRQVKAQSKVCVLVALGLYPQSERWGISGVFPLSAYLTETQESPDDDNGTHSKKRTVEVPANLKNAPIVYNSSPIPAHQLVFLVLYLLASDKPLSVTITP